MNLVVLDWDGRYGLMVFHINIDSEVNMHLCMSARVRNICVYLLALSAGRAQRQ